MHSITKILLFGLVSCISAPIAIYADNGPKESLYVPGAYEGWKPATAPVINAIQGLPGVYEGYVNITGIGTPGFKFTSASDWDHINYGYAGNGTLSTDGKAAALTVPEAGYYELSANLNKNSWTATKTVWSIIGDATSGGWQSDMKMSYDRFKQVWTIKADMKAAGSFKFRANGAWFIDFGLDEGGNLQYVDNPLFSYNPKLKNLTVSADGNYTITLDLHVSGKYTYNLVKN